MLVPPLTPDQRLKEMQANLDNAQRALEERSDGATAAEKTALRKKFLKADIDLNNAIADGLANNSGKLDDAVVDLENANKKAKKALEDHKTVVEILGKLQQAAEIAAKVLVAAA